MHQATGVLRQRTLDHFLSYGLLLLLAFAALAFGVVEPWSILVFECLSALLLLVWGIRAALDKRATLAIQPVFWPLVVLFVIGLVQSLARTDTNGLRHSLSLDVEATRAVTLLIGALLIGALLTPELMGQRRWLERLAWLLPLFGALIAVTGTLQRFTAPRWIYWLRDAGGEVFGPFVNRNHFAGYLELLVTFPLALIISRWVKGERRWLYGAASVAMGVAIIFTLSRGGMITLLAEIVFVAALGWQRARQLETHGRQRPVTLLAAVFIIVTIAAGIFWIGAEPVIFRITTGNMTSGVKAEQTYFGGRSEIWRNTWRMIQAHPLGIGLGAYETAYPIYRRDNVLNGIVAEAHNDYLQVLSDAGIIGALLIVWFLWAISRAITRVTRLREPLTAGLALGASGGIFGMLIHSFFDFNLQLPSHALLFLFLTGMVSTLGEVKTET